MKLTEFVQSNKQVPVVVKRSLQELVAALNAEQQVALNATNGAAIIACPGSGKTLTLTAIAALKLDKGESVFLTTFTKKAAQEIFERILPYAPTDQMYVGTVHSLAYRVVKKFMKDVKIIDDDARKAVIKKIFGKENVKYISEAISLFYNSPNLFQDAETIKKKFVEPYEKFLLEKSQEEDKRIIDIDQIIPYALPYVYKDPIEVDNILVDEAQDLNYIQYIFFKTFQYKNLYLIGDPIQNIYGFRGTSAEFFEKMIKDEGLEVITLRTNYRSAKTVIDIAEQIYKRDMIAHNEKQGTAKIIVVENEFENPKAVYSIIKKSTNKVAVLARTHLELSPISIYLTQNKVNHIVIGEFNFFKRKEIKDIMAYLDVIQNDSAYDSFERIIKVPPRGIGVAKMHDLQVAFKELKSITAALLKASQNWTEEAQKNAEDLVLLIDTAREMLKNGHNVGDVIKYIVQTIKYPEEPKRIKNVELLQDVASDYYDIEEFMNEIRIDEDFIKNKSDIILATIHAVKGLEFENVIIVNAVEERIPANNEIDQEKNLFYVAVTRAKENLYFIVPDKIIDRKNQFSVGDDDEEENVKGKTMKKSQISRFLEKVRVEKEYYTDDEELHFE